MTAVAQSFPGTIVPVSDCEHAVAETVGVWRAERVFREKLGAGHGEDSRDFQMVRERHVTGALGEMVLAKYLGVYWDPLPEDFGRWGDVGGYEVRTTTHTDGHLILFPSDPPLRCVFLVVVGGFCRVAGKLMVPASRTLLMEKWEQIARSRCRLDSPRQFWVPQSDLDLGLLE